MSLLMDALKKAEQEKKKALEDSGTYHRDPIVPIQAEGDTTFASGEHPSDAIREAVGNSSAANELTLEPLLSQKAPRVDAAKEEGIPTDPQALLDQFKAEMADMTLDLPNEGGQEAAARPMPDYDREATLPSERAIKSSLKDYFDASQSISRERPKVDIPPGASGQGSPSTGTFTTRVSAQTVFTAGHKTSSWKTGYTLATLTVLAVIPLLFYLIYIELRTPPSATLPLAEAPPVSDLLNRPEAPGLEATVPPAHTGPAETPLQADGLDKPAPDAPAVAMDTPSETTLAPETDVGAPFMAPETGKPETGMPGTGRDESRPYGNPNPSAGPRSTSKARMFDEYTEEASFVPLQAEPSAIKISKSRYREAIQPRVMQAYQAYRGGRYAEAKALYQAELARHPDNRDALLGLAAIAMHEGQREQSARYYQRVLHLNPKDSAANAGLLNLRVNSDGESQESRIKLLLEGQKSPHAFFGLGNLYARQSRWPEAQEAYFRAYAADDQNADYAFNLAVSLDHLGQNKAALSYYRQALSLADRQPVANFNTALILSRIQTLSSLAGVD
jgi:Flp pilus assembly protein TadD